MPKTQDKVVLIGVEDSPYVQRVIQVLKIGQYKYQFKKYNPIFGQSQLRKILKKPKDAKVSVPTAIIDGKGVTDSYDISYQLGTKKEMKELNELFDKEHIDDIKHISDISGQLVAYQRSEMFKYVQKDPAFGKKVFKLGMLGPLAPFAFKKMGDYMITKYKDTEGQDNKELAMGILRELRERLEGNGGKFLVGQHLTFADIAVVTSLLTAQNNKSLHITEEEAKKFLPQDFIDAMKALDSWAEDTGKKHFK